ncbi:2884_t:CDS:1, partial [Paraglomus occultum]
VLNTIKGIFSEIDKDTSLKKIWEETLDKSVKPLSQAEKRRYSSSSYE